MDNATALRLADSMDRLSNMLDRFSGIDLIWLDAMVSGMAENVENAAKAMTEALDSAANV